jgi:hypothetical protein
MTEDARRALTIVAAALWTILVAVGMTLLFRFAGTPGAPAAPPTLWPVESAIPRTPGHATIVMLAHPHCPCTRASIAELAVLMNRVADGASAHVLFMRPAQSGEGWEKTDLWQAAARIPGVTVHGDLDGVEAKRFAASTSGQTVVYDQAGRLMFHGGITASRGHQGDNAGLDRIISLMKRGKAGGDVSPVYGCPLGDPGTAEKAQL